MTPEQIDAIQRAPHAFASQDISACIAFLREQGQARRILPGRRESVCVNTRWTAADATHNFTVMVGFDAHGRAREVFGDNAKGTMQATISDACVLASIALQYGATPHDLVKSLGRIPVWTDEGLGEGPASPIGAIADTIIKILAQVQG